MRPVVVLGVLAVAAGCVGGGAEVNEPVPSLFDDSASTSLASNGETTSSAVSTTTVAIADRLPALAIDAPGAVLSSEGVLLPISDSDEELLFVIGPCGDDGVEPAATATLISAQHVVLDPGGSDGVAGGVNLAVAQRTADLLAADGVLVVLTRSGAAELGAATRGLAGPALGAEVLVSIHRGEGDSTAAGAPRPTLFHRAGDADSRRLAGLIHQEVVAAFGLLEGDFTQHEEPGVRPLLNQRGDNYFRVLQTSAGVAAARIELLALGENETTLLATEEGRDIEARALADAIVRFLVTSEEGDGFIDPIEAVRVAPTSDSPGGC